MGVPLVALLDEGTPVQVAAPFRARGHRAILHGEVLSPGTKDPVVAATAIQNNAVLVAIDRDMKQLAKRWGNFQDGGRYKRLNLVFIACNPVLAPKRVEQAMSFIEHEWDFACQKPTRALWLVIGPHFITSYR